MPVRRIIDDDMRSKIHIYFFLITALVLMASMYSCYYDNEAYLYNSGGGCNDTTYTYSGRVQAIMSQHCAVSGCHTGASPEAGIPLDSYTGVKNNAENGEFFCTINWNSGCSQMPKNSSKLDACTILALQEWKVRGYPEN
jgi:hypothetical protein